MGLIMDRLDAYMKHKSLNDNKVTTQAGLSVGLLGKSRNDGRDLSDKAANKILNFYTDLNPDWLLTGEGDMLLSTPRSAPAVETGKTDGSCTIPQSAWDVIQLQAKSLAAKDKQIEELIRQNGEVILMLKAKNAEPPKLPSLQRDEELKDAAAG